MATTHSTSTLLIGACVATVSFGSLQTGCANDSYTCVVDDDLLAEQWDCVLDEDCPCGAHCSMGQCAHDCRVDGDCAGDCDRRFGRCVESGQGLAPPAVDRSDTPNLTVHPNALNIRHAGEQRRVRVYAQGEEVGLLRVVADDGLLVQCRDATTFGPECVMQFVDPTEGLVLTLRAEDFDPGPDDSYREVRLFTDAGARARVGVTLGATALHATLAGDRSKRDDDPIPGVYTGWLRPGRAGVSMPSGDDWATLLDDPLVVPMTLEIWSDGTVRVSDALVDGGVVFPQRVGILDFETGALVLPDTTVLADDVEPGDLAHPEILMNTTTSSPLVFRSIPDAGTVSVSGEIRTEYTGVSEYAEPMVEWDLFAMLDPTLTLDDSSPPLDTHDELDAGVLDRMIEELPGEQSGDDLFEDFLCSGLGGQGVGWARVPGADGDDPHESCHSTGDLGCGDDLEPWAPLPLLAWSGDQNFDVSACVVDLLDVGAWGDCSGGDCSCADAPALGGAMAVAFEDVRTELLSDDYDEAMLTRTRLGHRLTQQWLELATWLPTEALGQAQRASAAGMVDPDAEVEYGEVLDALDASLQSWLLVLHPRVATALAALPPQVVATPDYRVGYLPTYEEDECAGVLASSKQTQQVGLPVSMLDTLQAQARVLAALLRHSRMDSRDVVGDDVRLRVGEYLRVALPVRGLAAGMVVRASEDGVPWQADWDIATDGFDQALAGLFVDLNDDGNPLGIQEEDLPLYGLGEQVGAGSRFFALSDYLLGTGDCLSSTADGYAMEACYAAHLALQAARDAWNAEIERDWSAANASLEQDRREEEVRRRYGDPVLSLCGYPSTIGGLDILDNWEHIDSDTCYMPNDGLVTALEATYGEIDPDDTMCPSMDPADYEGHLDDADVIESLCVASRVATELSPVLVDDECTDLYQQLAESIFVFGQAGDLRLEVAEYGGTVAYTIVGGGDSLTFPEACLYADVGRGFEVLPEGTYERGLELITTECMAVSQDVRSRRPITAPATCTQAWECPLGMVCDDSACVVEPLEEIDPACYRGALGEAALQVQAAAKTVEVARAELAEYSERYDIAMRSCFALEEGNSQIEGAIDAHNQTMYEMASAKLAFDIAANVAAAAKDSCDVGTLFSGGGKAAAAAVEATALSVSDGLQYGMDEAERAHDLELAAIEAATEETICYTDAEMHFVGATTQGLAIQTAMIDLASAMSSFNQLKTDVDGTVGDGVVALQMEQERRLAPMATAYWSDEKLAAFESAQRRAQRAAWLALRVVEYEQQQTLPTQRDAILAARSPMELSEVLSDLQNLSATGTVSGSAPTDLLVVVSLKEHLLQIADRSDFPTGWQTMTADQRFSWWLTDSAFSVSDANGVWIGQEIPFSLAPRSETTLLDSIPLRTSTDCGERIWSVNVSVLGEDVYVGGESSFGRVVVRKSNSFYSQWCDGDGRDEPYQTASTRPELNLLLDPYDDDWADIDVGSDALLESTSALVSAYLGVSQSELEDESYSSGDSQQLAGRGLYGDYSIFIPADWIADPSGDDGATEGFDLAAIDDILIRVDYLAVAR